MAWTPESRLKGAVTHTRRVADRTAADETTDKTRKDRTRGQARDAADAMLNYRAPGTKRVPSSGQRKSDRGSDPRRRPMLELAKEAEEAIGTMALHAMRQRNVAGAELKMTQQSIDQAVRENKAGGWMGA